MTATVQVFEEERALVIETDDPTTMLAHVPTAFQLNPLGLPRLIGMEHNVENVARLALMGVQAASPIEKYYHWPRDRTLIPFPFKHQIAQAAFFVSNSRGYCLSSIGVGKTMSAAWAADYLISVGMVHSVLIVSTLSSLERTWGDAIFCHLTHRRFKVLHGSAEKRRKLLAQPADIYIINYAGIAVLQKELLARPDIDLVILDESAECGKKNTGLWKSLDMLIYPPHRAPIPRVWAMTATPTPNSPEDAYPQCKLVTPTTVPQYFTQWKNMTMSHESTYIWIPRTEATKVVYDAMRPAIRFKRDECLDLPPAIYSTRDVELSTAQKKHYKEISKELYTKVGDAKVTALNEGIKLSKLLQIACGCVYDSEGTPQEIDAGNRIETLMELIEQVNERVIVFVPFEAVTAMLARALNKHWNFAIVTGQTPQHERNRIFADFQTKDADIDIVAHPGCMAHSLTLTEASTIIWYAPVNSNRTYEQANGRITRAGQKYTANIIHLSGSAVERKIYKRLELRQSTQGALLDMIEKQENLI